MKSVFHMASFNLVEAFKADRGAMVFLATGESALPEMKARGLVSEIDGAPHAVMAEVTPKLVRTYLWNTREHPARKDPLACVYLMEWDKSVLIGYSRLVEKEAPPVAASPSQPGPSSQRVPEGAAVEKAPNETGVNP